MGHERLVVEDTRGLVDGTVVIADQLVIPKVDVHDSSAVVHELWCVGAEENGLVVLDTLDNGVRKHVDFHVQISDRFCADNVVEPVDLDHSVVRVSRIVQQRNVLWRVELNHILHKCLGRRRDRLELAVLVVEVPRKFLVGSRRHPQKDTLQPVNLGDHLCLVVLHGLACSKLFPQNLGVLAQLGQQKLVHHAGCGGVVGVGIDGVRNNSVLVDDLGHHGELAAVNDRVSEEELNQTRTHVLFVRVADLVKEIVGLFELIVEKQVRRRELAFLQIELGHELETQHVGGGK
ncbi:hypothetical protein OGATHE_006207 [Ogataea polymorpha]|uniref:Uncharacterized protein n=1 Tax=Ogataea polymorpha TaxID=460523 RepID=A0A9P8NT19_9ASCO|nr:hypothetical protein OGATHE_006207 [Ogataea polymorpha]